MQFPFCRRLLFDGEIPRLIVFLSDVLELFVLVSAVSTRIHAILHLVPSYR
jgi:hypothetical protein